MAELKIDIEQSIAQFEQDMSRYPYGYNDTNIEGYLQSQLNILRKDIKEADAYKFSKKVLWRLVNSLIRNTGRNPNRVRLCRNLLNNNLSHFRLDIATKCTALNKLKKYGNNPGERLETYLKNKVQSDIEPEVKYKPQNYQKLIAEQMQGGDAFLYAPKAFAYMSNRFKQNPDMDLKTFAVDVDLLLQTAEKAVGDDKFIHFSNLYHFLQKKAVANPNTLPRSLFDDSVPEADTIHKRSVEVLALAYARRLYQAKDMKNVNRHYTAKFNNLMAAIIRKNSFTRAEVKDLAKRLQSQPWTSRSVEKEVNRLGEDLVDIFDKKQADEIRKLNTWFKQENKENKVERQAMLDVYVSELYKKLINGQDIGHDNLNRLYLTKKALLKSEINAAYAKEGVTDKETAQEQVLQNRHADNKDKSEVIVAYLDKKCQKTPFYLTVEGILHNNKLSDKKANIMLANRFFPEFDRY